MVLLLPTAVPSSVSLSELLSLSVLTCLKPQDKTDSVPPVYNEKIYLKLMYWYASWGRNTIDRALASHHEGRGSNLGGANKCPCTSSLNYMP